jgi:hypothetical protein
MKRYLCEILPRDGEAITPANAPAPETPPRATSQVVPARPVHGGRTVLNEQRQSTFAAGVTALTQKIQALRAQVAHAEAVAHVVLAKPASRPTPTLDLAVVQQRKVGAGMRHLAGLTDLRGFANDIEQAGGGDREFRPREAVALTPVQREEQIWAGIRRPEGFSK